MTGQGEPEDGGHRRHVQVEHGVLAAELFPGREMTVRATNPNAVATTM
jgi:hypothetical protein